MLWSLWVGFQTTFRESPLLPTLLLPHPLPVCTDRGFKEEEEEAAAAMATEGGKTSEPENNNKKPKTSGSQVKANVKRKFNTKL